LTTSTCYIDSKYRKLDGQPFGQEHFQELLGKIYKKDKAKGDFKFTIGQIAIVAFKACYLLVFAVYLPPSLDKSIVVTCS
jgi:hypothetical protein